MDPSIIPDLLSDEFEYIAGTAAQANEDRGKVSSFYIISVGSVVAAILGVPAEGMETAQINAAFLILFGLLSIIGFLTLLQLIRLRGAWFESAKAMAQIKEYYMKNFPEANLEEAFRWKMETLPATYKPWSLHFFQALQVALLAGLMVGAAIFFAGDSREVRFCSPPVYGGLGSVALQMLVYWRLLRSSK